MSESQDSKPTEIPTTVSGAFTRFFEILIQNANDGNFVRSWACCAFGALIIPLSNILTSLKSSRKIPDIDTITSLTTMCIILIAVAIFPVMIVRNRNLGKFVLLGFLLSLMLLYGVDKILNITARLEPINEAYAQPARGAQGETSDALVLVAPAPFAWNGSVNLDQLRIQGLVARVGQPARDTPKGWVFRPPYRSADWARLAPTQAILLRAGALERNADISSPIACIAGTADQETTFQSVFSGSAIGIWKSIEIVSVENERDCDFLNSLMAYLYGNNELNIKAKNSLNQYKEIYGKANSKIGENILKSKLIDRLDLSQKSRACDILTTSGLITRQICRIS